MIISLNSGKGIKKRILFPDQQPHIQIDLPEKGEKVEVICSMVNSKVVLELMMVASAIEEAKAIKSILFIPYLMGARFDRVMQPGDSYDLKVISNMINLCNFNEVVLYDPHSDKTSDLIRNAKVISNKFLVEEYDGPDAVLICPDLGASKKVHHYFEWNTRFRDMVQCIKERNFDTGELTIKVLNPEKCKGKHCVIVDDLCDGGGTFLGIADQIEPVSLTLIVTHGIFSKGFKSLEEKFDHIITSDSYARSYNSNKVNVIRI